MYLQSVTPPKLLSANPHRNSHLKVQYVDFGEETQTEIVFLYYNINQGNTQTQTYLFVP